MKNKYALVAFLSAFAAVGLCWNVPVRASALALQSASRIAAELAQEPSTQEKIAFRRKTIQTMRDELVQVSDLVKAARYGEAQATFERALRKWYTFGGTIKRIAPDSYAKISPNFAAVQRGLYNASVPLSTLRANLQTLIQDVNVAVPISDAQD
jgi:negative regulator of replication initiation